MSPDPTRFQRTAETFTPRSFNGSEDIEAIIVKGEERTAELNTKWEGLNFDELSNFKLDGGVQQWEGEDFQNRVCRLHCVTLVDPHCGLGAQRKTIGLNWIQPSKRERKGNYSIDGYYKDAMRAGPSRVDKAPKAPKPPKQLVMWVLTPMEIRLGH